MLLVLLKNSLNFGNNPSKNPSNISRTNKLLQAMLRERLLPVECVRTLENGQSEIKIASGGTIVGKFYENQMGGKWWTDKFISFCHSGNYIVHFLQKIVHHPHGYMGNARQTNISPVRHRYRRTV